VLGGGDTLDKNRPELGLELCHRGERSSFPPRARSRRTPDRLNSTGGKFGPMPASEEPQEDGDPLVGGLALVDREVIGERP
jgi:hypothetical protein